MNERAFERASRCFALARSTTFAGEREAAIDRGTRIANAAGLSLDSFDIPGRKRQTQPASDRLFEGEGFFRDADNFRYVVIDPSEIEEILREMNEAFARQSEAVNSERARRERDRQRRTIKVHHALNWLFARGVRMYRAEGDLFISPDHHDAEARFTEEDVLTAAQSRGWRG